MAFIRAKHIRISAIAAAVPAHQEKNTDYEWLSPAEREMFIKTTGIAVRRVADSKTSTSDLCYVSAEKILNDLKTDRSEIDILIFVSQSPDYLLPATSIILQDRLKLGKHTMAFDISLGCSGYVYGLSVIASLMQNAGFRKGLLMAGDISTHSQNYKDKTTYPLFGDAGTATLLEYTPEEQEMTFHLNSDGSGYKAIMQPDGGIRSPITPESFIEREYEPGVIRTSKGLHMNGSDVFNFSITEAPLSVKEVFTAAHTGPEQIDYFIMHQANKLLNETIRKKLKIDADKVPYTLSEFGNTSSASIPITIVHRLGKAVSGETKKLCLSGFGVGLSWASAVLDVDHVYCPPVIEI
jgi:3-oxoacyl-[acyl-carrier-protein] synthase-3